MRYGDTIGLVRWSYNVELESWQSQHVDGLTYIGADDQAWLVMRGGVLREFARPYWEATLL